MDDGSFYFSMVIIALILAWMFIPLKKSENEPTTINYWTNMNIYEEYSKELKRIDSCLKEKREKMGNLCCIINTSKNISDKSKKNAEKNYKTTIEELRMLGNYRHYIIYPKVCYYKSKVKEITREMNIRGMWELAS